MSLLKGGRFNAKFLVFIPVLLILAVWLYVKLTCFRICEYDKDLFTHLQISKCWLEGRPLLYENAYGYHDRLHNYYFTPLLGLFTHFIGAYGLFIAHLLLVMAGAFILIKEFAKNTDKRISKLMLILLFVFYLGPSGFWVWSNSRYGFHPELLYVPLSLLFAWALYNDKKAWVIIAALSIILIKEDGAVLGGCIYFSWLFLKTGKTIIKSKGFRWEIIRAFSLWAIVFAAGILFLYYKNGFGHNRMSAVTDKFSLIHYSTLKSFSHLSL